MEGIAAITGDVASMALGMKTRRLRSIIMLCNDVSLRSLIRIELGRGLASSSQTIIGLLASRITTRRNLGRCGMATVSMVRSTSS